MLTSTRPIAALLLLLILLVCAGLTLGLTYAPCFASLCSEDFFPLPVRFHIVTFYGLLASIGGTLLLRAYSPLCLSISKHYLSQRRLPVLGKRISVGGLALALWIVTITVASTGFWEGPEYSFWGLRTIPLDWADAQIRLTVTGVIGHHADILLGLVLIPVSRNSVLGRAFELHQSTLLYAHKLLAYLLVIAVLAHGAATYTFVATYAAANDDSPKKDAFNVDNPTLTGQQTERQGVYHSATLGTGMISFVLMVVIVITALPVLRRRAYNTFYYAHIICSILIFVSASFHASTDFYFLLPGLLLWIIDWGWRLFRGDTGIRVRVEGVVQDADDGWYRIVLPVHAKSASRDECGQSIAARKGVEEHPLQSYYLNIPTVSKIQSHAFTAAKIGTASTGPVFLLQRAPKSGKKKEQKQDKEWTWKLGHLTSSTGIGEREATTKVDIRVEGPYTPTNIEFQSANHIVCIVGGTGITGAYSLALWWRNHRLQESSARFTLVWTVRYRQMTQLLEWRELEQAVGGSENNMQLQIHVSSEDGRLDVTSALREEFANSTEKEVIENQRAWIYVSGPAGLLDKAEDACVDLKKELKEASKAKRQTGLTVGHIEYYMARWEV